MRDFLEDMEDNAERRYEAMEMPDGQLKCSCGKIFNPDKEGGVPNSNPWAMPVCGDCLFSGIED